MATIQDQNKLLLPEKKIKEGKGGLDLVKEVKDYAKEKKKQITEKAKNIAGGVNEVIKAITPSKKLKDKVKKIAKPFVDESVAIRHLTKKDKE